MKALGGLILAAAAALSLSLPAYAETPGGLDKIEVTAGKYTGCHVGAHVGWSRSGTRGSIETAGGPIPGFAIERDREDAAIGGVSAGCDVEISRVVIGFAGDWTAGSSSVASDIVAGGVALASSELKVRDSYALIARLGFLVRDDLLAYALVGHTWARTSGLSIEAPGGAVGFSMPDMAGWTIGGGLEFAPEMLKGFSVKVEYRFTDFDRERVDLMPALQIGHEHVDHSVRVGVSYRFGQ